jgi:hypothetical protein
MLTAMPHRPIFQGPKGGAVPSILRIRKNRIGKKYEMYWAKLARERMA